MLAKNLHLPGLPGSAIRRVAVFPYGTHAIFIGEVERVRLSSPVLPLIYHDATYCTSAPAVAAA